MKRTDTDLLQDILESIAAIERHPAGSRVILDEDDVLCGFLQRRIEIIGEAASRLNQSTSDKAPDIRWRQVRGMRNRLIHDYANVDLDMVWHVLQNEITLLRQSALR